MNELMVRTNIIYENAHFSVTTGKATMGDVTQDDVYIATNKETGIREIESSVLVSVLANVDQWSMLLEERESLQEGHKDGFQDTVLQ